MNKLVSLILLIGGVVFVAYGVNASESVGSDISRLFDGAPTDKALWLFIGGGVMAAAGRADCCVAARPLSFS